MTRLPNDVARCNGVGSDEGQLIIQQLEAMRGVEVSAWLRDVIGGKIVLPGPWDTEQAQEPLIRLWPSLSPTTCNHLRRAVVECCCDWLNLARDSDQTAIDQLCFLITAWEVGPNAFGALQTTVLKPSFAQLPLGIRQRTVTTLVEAGRESPPSDWWEALGQTTAGEYAYAVFEAVALREPLRAIRLLAEQPWMTRDPAALDFICSTQLPLVLAALNAKRLGGTAESH